MKHADQIALIDSLSKSLARQGFKLLNERQFSAVIKAATMVCEAIAQQHVPAAAGMGLQAWWSCDETGLSSRCMARALARCAGLFVGPTEQGWHGQHEHPSDPADFARCLGLLAAEPRLREYLQRMAEVSPQWAGLVAHWDELESLFREEAPRHRCPKLYARMRALLDGASEHKETTT